MMHNCVGKIKNPDIKSPRYNPNKGKKIGAGLGIAAGLGIDAYSMKIETDFIKKCINEGKLKGTNLTGNIKDYFITYQKINPNTGKLSLKMLDKAGMHKKIGIMGKIVAIGAVAGTVIGAVADKIKQLKIQKAQKVLSEAIEKYVAEGEKDGTIETIKFDEL